MATWTAKEWAAQEFGGVDLGDARRVKRLVKVGAALAEKAGGTLPGVLGDWAELKAAYRLLHRPEATLEAVGRPHWERVRCECAAPGECLLIEDTSEVDYTPHEAVAGLGRIGDDRGRGFLLHTTLAVRVEGWKNDGEPVANVLGLFGQQLWTREGQPKRGRETKTARWQRERESQKWGAMLEETNGPPVGSKWIEVGDRESDVAEMYARCARQGADWIVRAAWDRALEAEDRHLFRAAGLAPVRGRFELGLRARPGQAARKAQLEVRSRSVTLRGPWRPGGRLPSQQMQVVYVREVDAPRGTVPLEWMLLTSLPCETLAQCVKVVKRYSLRWLVEEYHKALKTGTGVEESQLETAAALRALIAVLALVAVRLLALKLVARVAPQQAVDVKTLGAEVWAVLEKKYGRPPGGWTTRATLVAIARLGGFLARKGDGDPGWLTIWRGWQRLMDLAEGYHLAASRSERCG
jgi:hypothetical protein